MVWEKIWFDPLHDIERNYNDDRMVYTKRRNGEPSRYSAINIEPLRLRLYFKIFEVLQKRTSIAVNALKECICEEMREAIYYIINGDKIRFKEWKGLIHTDVKDVMTDVINSWMRVGGDVFNTYYIAPLVEKYIIWKEEISFRGRKIKSIGPLLLLIMNRYLQLRNSEIDVGNLYHLMREDYPEVMKKWLNVWEKAEEWLKTMSGGITTSLSAHRYKQVHFALQSILLYQLPYMNEEVLDKLKDIDIITRCRNSVKMEYEITIKFDDDYDMKKSLVMQPIKHLNRQITSITIDDVNKIMKIKILHSTT